MIKIIKYKFKPANTIGKEETRETLKVMKSGALSSYLGSKGPEFLGGKYVKKFEKKICEFFNVKYAICAILLEERQLLYPQSKYAFTPSNSGLDVSE